MAIKKLMSEPVHTEEGFTLISVYREGDTKKLSVAVVWSFPDSTSIQYNFPVQGDSKRIYDGECVGQCLEMISEELETFTSSTMEVQYAG